MPSTSIEIRTHAQRHVYRPVPAARVPTQLRWDVPKPNQGQIVEVAYADAPGHASPAGAGSTWLRRHDHADGSVTCYRRVRSTRR